jgi:hypothetical protein
LLLTLLASSNKRKERMAGRPRESEESPDSLQQWRRVTPAWGNPRESATENKPLTKRE